MRVFEFDNAIYKGDLVNDLLSFVISKKEKYKSYLPLIKPLLVLYNMDLLSASKIESFVDKYDDKIFASKEQVVRLGKMFFEENADKLDEELLKKVKRGDLIITVAPKEFLEPLKLKTKKIFGTEIDYETNDVQFVCYKERRYEKYNELYGDLEVDEYYTASKKDKDMINRAKKTIYR